MFSFHKPKIYRSNAGCCICKAKSSSSRFTDSKKYEAEFERCFRIQEQRAGEICNACVLLVKRWKKLSPENRCIKHWHHVVDARAGPALKLSVARARHAHRHFGVAKSTNSVNVQQQIRDPTATSPPTEQRIPNEQQRKTPLSQHQQATDTSRRPGRRDKGVTKTPLCPLQTTASLAATSNIAADDWRDQRKSYMSTETLLSTSNTSSSPFFGKPNSALNSAAFEEVILRYKQRQAREQLETKRRQDARQQRRLGSGDTGSIGGISSSSLASIESPPPSSSSLSTNEPQEDSICTQQDATENTNNVLKQTAECSKNVRDETIQDESFASLFVDGFRVSSVLDTSLWRKQLVCCGTIFKGLNDEVAIFPKLFKPHLCPKHCVLGESYASKNNSTSLLAVNEKLTMISSSSDDSNEAADDTDSSTSASGDANSTTAASSSVAKADNNDSAASVFLETTCRPIYQLN